MKRARGWPIGFKFFIILKTLSEDTVIRYCPLKSKRKDIPVIFSVLLCLIDARQSKQMVIIYRYFTIFVCNSQIKY